MTCSLACAVDSSPGFLLGVYQQTKQPERPILVFREVKNSQTSVQVDVLGKYGRAVRVLWENKVGCGKDTVSLKREQPKQESS